MNREEEDEPALAWGDDLNETEIMEALGAICDGHPMNALLKLTHKNGLFAGFEVCDTGVQRWNTSRAASS